MLNYVVSIPFEEPCKYIDRPNKLQKLMMMLFFEFSNIFSRILQGLKKSEFARFLKNEMCIKRSKLQLEA